MERRVQNGTHPAPEEYRIRIVEGGPYLVYGRPPLSQQFIVLDERGDSWAFRQGESYPLETTPTALCRCGASRKAPYCDGSHIREEWGGEVEGVAADERLLDGAQMIEGPVLALSDNEKYCAFARFCDAAGRVWNNVKRSDNSDAHDLTIRQASLCPSGRLSAWDRSSGLPFEPHYEPSLALIEDPVMMASGGLWVRGGIVVENGAGESYEVRNRTLLCRCGSSSRKPFCDGSHAAIHFDDGLPQEGYIIEDVEVAEPVF